MRKVTCLVGAGVAAAAWLVLAPAGPAEAGKPGGGGTTAPGGTIVFVQQVTVQGPTTSWPEGHLHATNAAGTAWRSLGLVSNASVSAGGINRVKTNYYQGGAVEVAGKIWVTGKRTWYSDVNGNLLDDPGERTAWDLIAACEGGAEVTLATSATSDVSLTGGSYFLPDADRIRAHTRRTSGADPGIWDAAISWSSGVPSIVPTDGQDWVLVLAESDVPGAVHLSPDLYRVVGRDATANTLWIRTRTPSGGWSAPQTIASGPNDNPVLSPDASRVLYRSQGGLRIVNADGSGDVAVLSNSSSTFYDFGVWSPDGANLAVNKRRQTTAWSNTLNWAPAKSRSSATQIGNWDYVQLGSWLP